MSVATPVKDCRTPRCGSPSGHGTFGNFCEACAERLARVREDLEGGTSFSGNRTEKGRADAEARAARKRSAIARAAARQRSDNAALTVEELGNDAAPEDVDDDDVLADVA